MAKRGEIKDITGQRFGFLTATSFFERKFFPSGQAHNVWNCICDCGKETTASIGMLCSGKKKSCGCKWKDFISEARTVHGYCRRREETNKTWLCWWNMLQRCTNPKSERFNQYGGRGITVCERWIEFANFLADMGDKPEGKSIERADVNGSYCPENCSWILNRDQFENMQKSIRITIGGDTKSLKRWSTELGLNYLTVYGRYKRGESISDVFRPVKK